jgi:hypothetical protein
MWDRANFVSSHGITLSMLSVRIVSPLSPVNIARDFGLLMQTLKRPNPLFPSPPTFAHIL